jgi:hypothetical protein
MGISYGEKKSNRNGPWTLQNMLNNMPLIRIKKSECVFMNGSEDCVSPILAPSKLCSYQAMCWRNLDLHKHSQLIEQKLKKKTHTHTHNIKRKELINVFALIVH